MAPGIFRAILAQPVLFAMGGMPIFRRRGRERKNRGRGIQDPAAPPLCLSSAPAAYRYRWQKRMRMVAIWARVAEPPGVRVVAVVPFTRPSALAQERASAA